MMVVGVGAEVAGGGRDMWLGQRAEQRGRRTGRVAGECGADWWDLSRGWAAWEVGKWGMAGIDWRIDGRAGHWHGGTWGRRAGEVASGRARWSIEGSEGGRDEARH